MLTTQATQEMIDAWKKTWREHRDSLTPNRKSGAEILAYLLAKYELTERHDAAAREVISGNVLENAHYAEKLPPGAAPAPRAFIVQDSGAGAELYAQQDEIFAGNPIFVGVDTVSGMYHAEGSSALWDELCAFQGLDAADIENFFCVAQYIACREKFAQEEI